MGDLRLGLLPGAVNPTLIGPVQRARLGVVSRQGAGGSQPSSRGVLAVSSNCLQHFPEVSDIADRCLNAVEELAPLEDPELGP